MATRITVDPVTRIEGHLRIDVEANEGKVVKAWASGTMWRGIETIVKGRDALETWLFAQRICGVCTTVHGLASVRAAESALNLEIPVNAQLIRNIIIGAHAVHDHIVHFYHLAALDWVDVVSALKADPKKAGALAEGLSDWPKNGAHEMKAVQDRLKTFVASGQLGPFANAYWGHPAMKLSPEVNLIAVAHYLQALEYQNYANKAVAILGGKTPHIQNLAVGGVANAINLDSEAVLNMERLLAIKAWLDKLDQFVKSVMLVDVPTVAAFYPEWLGYGSGITNYLAVPEMPQDSTGTEYLLPGGYLLGGDVNSFKPIKTQSDPYLVQGVKESSKHAWYQGDAPLHPWEGQTEPNYTDFQDDGRYSWVKAPTFHGRRFQVGPLPHVMCMVAAGHEPTKRYLDQALKTALAVGQREVPLSALHSTLGRIAARAVRCAVVLDTVHEQWHKLVENIGRGDTVTFNRPEFPKGEVRGVGFHEAPRGVLSHWAVIENGKIKNYQAVVPTTWNAGPRDENDVMGPYEASLMDNPIADPDRPLEVLRTVHSFDPCLACAVHLMDADGTERVRVKAL
jgi:hydrogenase large subunit